MNSAVIRFFKKPIFTDYRFIVSFWMVVALLSGITKALSPSGIHGNYKIYKYVFWNTIERFPLYLHRPEAYGDLNHYGPIFGLIIAPFAVLPDFIGATLWLLCLTALLFFAIKELPLKQWQHAVIYWICLNSLIIAHTNVQFNTASAALIILSYTMIRKEKDMWAAFMIMLGTFVKLYGIVGFAFFFFSKHKPKLLLWSVIWSILFFVLPMLISSPEFIIAQYKGWYTELIIKNNGNNGALLQNISLIGLIKKTTGHLEWSNIPIILSGLIAFAIPYLRIQEYKQVRFQLLTLASVLLFTVLFSTGSEPNTYVIAIVGVAIWFVVQPRPFSKWDWGLLLFAMILASFGPSDLFPRTLYNRYVLPNALQALPCTLIWLRIVYEMVFRQSDNYLTGE